MVWQIIAIVLIAGATLYWFVRDERRQKLARLAARARHFATAPAFRHRGSAPIAPRPDMPLGLSPSDRMFLEAFARRRKNGGA